jgi:hypothetical protein
MKLVRKLPKKFTKVVNNLFFFSIRRETPHIHAVANSNHAQNSKTSRVSVHKFVMLQSLVCSLVPSPLHAHTMMSVLMM